MIYRMILKKNEYWENDILAWPEPTMINQQNPQSNSNHLNTKGQKWKKEKEKRPKKLYLNK